MLSPSEFDAERLIRTAFRMSDVRLVFDGVHARCSQRVYVAMRYTEAAFRRLADFGDDHHIIP